MRRKPKGQKCRNLVARSEVIYYEKVADGHRVKFSCKTSDWDEAAAVRDLYEQRAAERRAAGFAGHRPTFAEVALPYLEQAKHHLAPSTWDDRRKLLREGGPILEAFGALRLDDIDRKRLRDFWQARVVARGRTRSTGRNYINTISAVFAFAEAEELIDRNPVADLRRLLRAQGKTKQARAEADGRKVNPIVDLENLAKLVAASERAYEMRFGTGRAVSSRRDGHITTLLMLDAGLRAGEVGGLRWRHIRWGDGPDDLSRALEVCESRARGKFDGPPKSGRRREVELSRRLRALLRAYWVAKGQPAPQERVIPGFSSRNYAERHFGPCSAEAGLSGHTPKDLRDTYASQLITAGIQLAHISRQLGHADVAVTAQHYARWCGSTYRVPLIVAPGEVPADLLARLEGPSLEMWTTTAGRRE